WMVAFSCSHCSRRWQATATATPSSAACDMLIPRVLASASRDSASDTIRGLLRRDGIVTFSDRSFWPETCENWWWRDVSTGRIRHPVYESNSGPHARVIESRKLEE